MLVATLGWQAPSAQAQTCAPPTNVAVSNVTNTSAVVSFVPSATAISYTVRFYSIDSTAAGITSVNATASPVTLTGLVAGRFHRVTVVSNCAGGFTTSAPWMGFQTTGGAGPVGCTAPTGLSVTALTSTSASISFTGASSSYRVVYYAVGDSAHAITQTVTGTPAGLTGLLPGTQYVVRLYSNCNGATSTPANITFRTIALPAACGAVTNVVVTGTGATTATVSFTPGLNNTRFTVTYYAPNDSSHVAMGTSSPITLNGLVPGRTYTIQVMSACGTGTTITYTPSAPITYAFRGTLAARAGLGAGTLSVFPNPAQRVANVLLPAMPGTREAQVQLLNALGQQVRRVAVPLAGADTQTQLDLTGLVPGLYTVQVRAAGQTASQRLAVE
jgi:hypothetical protein